eukprot:CAMPEP_0185167706 /NCGR_PEP_ID=MMETSP1139-20130426/14710_1 /TAXON_ID=298111 /ORGANISM="Pavlova sp., Strain CCMP459" /LENGTH=78 /DNA_ID=CAMNT_0027733195 /DNA_START=192 /DNA_END=424 /DNA_ORIENTATION=+
MRLMAAPRLTARVKESFGKTAVRSEHESPPVMTPDSLTAARLVSAPGTVEHNGCSSVSGIIPRQRTWHAVGELEEDLA